MTKRYQRGNTDNIDSSYFSIPERTKIYRIGYLYWIRNCLHFWNKWAHPCFQWGSICPILNFLFTVFGDLCLFELFPLTIVLSVLWFTSSYFPFGIFWSLYCLFFDLRLLITTLVYFGHYIVCSLTYVFWLHLWYLLVIVLSVLQKTYIKEQTIQWPKDTKGVTRRRISKNRQYNDQKIPKW
jgi:hypothetical protein